MCCEERLTLELHQRGLRLTPQREVVLRVLHDLQDGASIDEIGARVAGISPAVDLSTVYRTLDLFEELRLVSSFKAVDGVNRYELLTTHSPHCHLLCQHCGESITIHRDELQPLANHLLANYRFTLNQGHLVLPGICAQCRETIAPDGTLVSMTQRCTEPS